MVFEKETEEYIKEKLCQFEHVTKKSHFVKQEYMKNWSQDKSKVLASIDGGPYHLISTENICHKRYMYKLEPLTNTELLQIKNFYSESPQIVKNINDRFLDKWQYLCTLIKYSEEETLNTNFDQNLFEKVLIQTGEDLESILESSYTDKIKKCLLSCDESFLFDDNEKLNFCIFLISQYLRTQKSKRKIIENFKNKCDEDFNLNPERLWKVLIFVVTHMAAFNFLSTENIHIKFLKSSNHALITGDQPIVNIGNTDSGVDKFYFPVTPCVGLIFPSDKNETIENDIALINEMNERIKKSCVRYTIKYNGK